MLASIAHGESRIGNFATSADCAATIECFRRLGVSITHEGNIVTVAGQGKRGLTEPDGPLDCGNSGTTMRLISGILAGQPFESVLTGDESLCSRPMRRIIEPLEAMGAAINSNDGKAPLTIRGGDLRSINYETPVASAQVKSCVLLAGLYGDGITTVVESTATRDHTERMLRGFGVDVVESDVGGRREISVSGDGRLTAAEISVPGDISSAAFFLVAAACLPGSLLLLKNVGVNPTRAAIVDVLQNLGVSVKLTNRRESSGEPVADIVVTGGLSRSATEINRLDGPIIANLIDEIPALAVLGTQLDGGLEIRDAKELRVKESDRISSIVADLKSMGAEIEEFDDGFRVEKSRLSGSTLNSFGDHRIAMAFAVAALLAEGESEIVNAECAAVSYPAFYETLSEVTR
jgi:3-phosphoshikimate 1-carboxyvinyltransferase